MFGFGLWIFRLLPTRWTQLTLPAFCAVCQSTLSLLQGSRFPIPVNPLFQPHRFASSSTAWHSLLIFLGTSFTSFCIYWQNMALGDTNCAVEALCAIRLCGRRKHGRISLISQWIVPVMSWLSLQSLSCVIDEVHVSPFCSLIYYFIRMTGYWGLGRVVWVLRLMSEWVPVSTFCLGFCLFGCCSSAAAAHGCVLQDVFVQPLLPLVLLEQGWTLLREVWAVALHGGSSQYYFILCYFIWSKVDQSDFIGKIVTDTQCIWWQLLCHSSDKVDGK